MTGEQKAFLSFCCSVVVLQFSLSCAQLLARLWQGSLPELCCVGLGGGPGSPGTMGMSPSPHRRNQKNRRTPFSLIMSAELQIKNKGRGSSLGLMLFWDKKMWNAFLPGTVSSKKCKLWSQILLTVDMHPLSGQWHNCMCKWGWKHAGLLPDSTAVHIVCNILGTQLVLPSIISEASF